MKKSVELFVESLWGEDKVMTIPVNTIDKSKGHGDTLSVKIVIPTFCQANCEFCFNKHTWTTQQHDFGRFLSNLRRSLYIIKESLTDRKITIDITGNEPTFTPKLSDVLDVLKSFKSESLVDKVVLTTNGFNLLEFDDLDPVDIVNISVHDCRFEKRKKIFRTRVIPTNADLESMCDRFNTTAVAVCCDDYEDFEDFVLDFADFARLTGFRNARIRTDYLGEGGIFYDAFKDAEIISAPGLDKKLLNINGFGVDLYRGIKDLTSCIIGAEVVIDDDGCLYLDYNKRYPIGAEHIREFNDNIFVKKLW